MQIGKLLFGTELPPKAIADDIRILSPVVATVMAETAADWEIASPRVDPICTKKTIYCTMIICVSLFIITIFFKYI